jgi:phosphomannomutase
MIYLFDVDGTLTEARSKMDLSFAMFFLSWMTDKQVYLVSGSDLEKIEEQVPSSILKRCDGTFSSMGNVLHIKDELVYRNEIKIPKGIYEWLESKIEESTCPAQTSRHFDYRPGMMNFSICGRDVSRRQRLEYNKWDEECKEREGVAGEFNEKFNKENFEACLGGQISLDIQALGKNKSQASKWIRKTIKDNMTFFGDKCFEGGNDEDICNDLRKNKDGVHWQVRDWKDTMKTLTRLQKGEVF